MGGSEGSETTPLLCEGEALLGVVHRSDVWRGVLVELNLCSTWVPAGTQGDRDRRVQTKGLVKPQIEVEAADNRTAYGFGAK
eukprot:1716979-Pyramimonas_sp.AAC.1